jgi:hypothetical protein
VIELLRLTEVLVHYRAEELFEGGQQIKKVNIPSLSLSVCVCVCLNVLSFSFSLSNEGNFIDVVVLFQVRRSDLSSSIIFGCVSCH